MKKLKIFSYIFKEYFILISLMTVCRILFIGFNKNGIAEVPLKIIGKSFLYGWIFDNAVTCYYLGLLLILLLFYWVVQIIKLGIIGKIIINLYKIIMSSVIFLILLSDIQYYRVFNFHLNATVLDYLDHTDEIGDTILFGDYNLTLMIILFLIIEIVYLNFSFRAFKKVYERKMNFFDKISDLIMIFLAGILAVFGGRGGFSQGTLNWGRAYFSTYTFANQTALNGVFALGKSIDVARKDNKKEKSQIGRIFTDEELKNNMRKYIATENDTFLSDKNILLRKTDTHKEMKKYNVVIVLMESFMGDTVGVLGGDPDLTPNYNKLSEEGILFTNFYSNGNRSNRGILSVLTGFPSQYGQSILKKPAAQTPFISIADILKERGYSTHFMYGGDIEFDNMKGFLNTNGVDHIISQNNFPLSERTIKWGVPDDTLFERAVEYLGSLKQPFFFEIFTLSNHAPFDIPDKFKEFTEDDYEDYARYNAFKFADYSLGKFVEAVRDKEWAKNTVFIFVADHGENRRKAIDIDWKKFSNPLVIWMPGGQLKPEKFTKAGSQLDLLSTIMGILGGEYVHSSWGKDLLNYKGENNFAYVVENNFIGIIDEDKIYMDGITVGNSLRRKSDDSIINDEEARERYEKAARSYLELSIEQEKQRSFGKE